MKSVLSLVAARLVVCASLSANHRLTCCLSKVESTELFSTHIDDKRQQINTLRQTNDWTDARKKKWCSTTRWLLPSLTLKRVFHLSSWAYFSQSDLFFSVRSARRATNPLNEQEFCLQPAHKRPSSHRLMIRWIVRSSDEWQALTSFPLSDI